jgi:hypothetical protein
MPCLAFTKRVYWCKLKSGKRREEIEEREDKRELYGIESTSQYHGTYLSNGYDTFAYYGPIHVLVHSKWTHIKHHHHRFLHFSFLLLHNFKKSLISILFNLPTSFFALLLNYFSLSIQCFLGFLHSHSSSSLQAPEKKNV